MEKNGLRLGGDFNRAAGIPTQQFGGITSELTKETKQHTSIFQKIQNLNQGSLLKLVGISGGIGLLVGAMTKASPLLAGVFKLFETTFLIFLRPFANLLAFALLPLSLALLRASLYFNSTFGPTMIALGKSLGPSLANLIDPNFWKLAITDPFAVILAQGIPGIGTLGDAINALVAFLSGKPNLPTVPTTNPFKSELFRRPFEMAMNQPPPTTNPLSFQPIGAPTSQPGLFPQRKPTQEVIDRATNQPRVRGSRGGAAPMSFTMNVQNFSGAFAELKTAQNQIGGWITNKMKELGLI